MKNIDLSDIRIYNSIEYTDSIIVSANDTYWYLHFDTFQEDLNNFIENDKSGWCKDSDVGEYISSLNDFKENNPEYFI